jgi:hypothetical protein
MCGTPFKAGCIGRARHGFPDRYDRFLRGASIRARAADGRFLQFPQTKRCARNRKPSGPRLCGDNGQIVGSHRLAGYQETKVIQQFRDRNAIQTHKL